MNTDVNHNVCSNNSSLLFDRFLAENILSINLKIHFPGHYGILRTNPRRTQSISVTFINRLEVEMVLE